MKETIFDNCIVGSGPAAISFILARNLYSNQKDKILWIEAGDALNNKNEIVKKNNFSSPKYNNIEFKKSNDFFISKYNISCQNINLVSCLRKGGNGSIWGAAISEFTEEEFGLPKKNYLELKDSYKEISSYFSFANQENKEKNNSLLIFSSIKKLIFKRFKDVNFQINYPKLAINIKNKHRYLYDYNIRSIVNDDNHGIFNTKLEINNIKNSKNITFKENYFLDNFTLENNIFKVNVTDLKEDNALFFKSKKLTLATGAIASPILISKFIDKKIETRIQHNPAYFFSFFNFNKYFWKLNEKFVYLSNAEYFINDKYLKTLFGQIYPSFILSNQILRNRFKFLELIPAFLLNLIKRQICLSTIYLDGSFSSTYMKIDKNYVKIYSKNFNKHDKYTKSLKRIIKRYFKLILPFGSTIIENGTDAHYGCTIPYSKNNKILTTNEYGKIKSLNNNLTIIDGSILKNLPSKPLTFTIMANAFRIGKNEYHKI